MTKPKKPKPAPTITIRKDGSKAVSYGPAKGSWPPFETANMSAFRHGCNSARVVSIASAGIKEELRALHPLLFASDDPVDLEDLLVTIPADIRDQLRARHPWAFGAKVTGG